ncbi:ABC transporter permease [Corynebacterium vitaeruminis]|uniref:ABC transporter permease n=2 Tax=Corynebacterium vitaeruminis TaxID=38305 RepID=UPI0028A85521|nr:ABC transporter permease subunit [Corynebacterium vitaeruminis]
MMTALLHKDTQEILRTWRVWLLALVALLSAASGPIVTRYTTDLLQALGGAELGDLVSALPQPTFMEAHAQWLKDLNQVVLLALGLVAGSTAASELADGSYLFTLTRGVPRWKFLASKLASFLGVSLALLFLAVAVNAGVTYLVFHDVTWAGLCKGSLVWFASATLTVSVAFLVGVLTFSQVGAAGAAIGTTILLGALGMWDKVARWSPAGLSQQAHNALTGQPVSAWPILTAVVAALVLLLVTAAVLERKEL